MPLENQEYLVAKATAGAASVTKIVDFIPRAGDFEKPSEDVLNALRIAIQEAVRAGEHAMANNLYRALAFCVTAPKYIEKLEQACIDWGDYRCESCKFVFGVDDIVFCDDVDLCEPCFEAENE